MSRTRAIIYLALITTVLMYRAYEQDREGMMLCMLVMPMALYAVVHSEDK